MSEFTSGYLFLTRDEETVRQSPPPTMVLDERWQELKEDLWGGKKDLPPFIIRPLNERWSLLLIEEISADEASKTQLEKWVLGVSAQCPILYFYNAEDHAWGYRLFKGGAEVASVEVNYEIRLMQEMYGDDADEETDETEAAAEYFETMVQQYEHKNIGEFAVFDLEADSLDELDEILTAEWYLDSGIWDQVEEFKDCLEITEMSWTSYDYEITDNYLD